MNFSSPHSKKEITIRAAIKLVLIVIAILFFFFFSTHHLAIKKRRNKNVYLDAYSRNESACRWFHRPFQNLNIKKKWEILSSFSYRSFVSHPIRKFPSCCRHKTLHFLDLKSKFFFSLWLEIERRWVQQVDRRGRVHKSENCTSPARRFLNFLLKKKKLEKLGPRDATAIWYALKSWREFKNTSSRHLHQHFFHLLFSSFIIFAVDSFRLWKLEKTVSSSSFEWKWIFNTFKEHTQHTCDSNRVVWPSGGHETRRDLFFLSVNRTRTVCSCLYCHTLYIETCAVRLRRLERNLASGLIV